MRDQTMPHANYFEIAANTYYELGVQQGELFRDFVQESVWELRREGSQHARRNRLKSCLAVTRKALPHVVEELEGYADGAQVSFDALWLLSTESEPFEAKAARCTTAVAHRGLLVGHNEDWDADEKDSICVMRKSIPPMTILELFYLNTLGGNALSVNSHGFVQAINTLTHTDEQIGVPRNMVARWLSETRSPDDDYKKLLRVRRDSGYSHNFVNTGGRIWNIECSATQQQLARPKSPFVHTNHFLTQLRRLQAADHSGSANRYNRASSKMKDSMSVDAVKELLSDTSQGKDLSIFNRRTIARTIVDLQRMSLFIWLLREADRGWVQYDLDFVAPKQNRWV